MRLSKIKRNAIDYGGKIMSNFFDETMQGLLEAAERVGKYAGSHILCRR